MPLLKHSALALIVSFGLSVFFWLALGVFNLQGFWAVSIGCAFLGVVLGLVFFRRLWVTGAATAMIRVLVFLVVSTGTGM